MKTKKLKKKHDKETHKHLVLKKDLLCEKNLKNNFTKFFFIIPFLIAITLGVYYVYNLKTEIGNLGFPLDDPWIHLTFAKNLIQYGAFSYYKNEIVTSGSTSPLYTLLSTIFFILIKNEFILSYSIGIIFYGLAALIIFLIIQQTTNSNLSALIFSILFALQPKLSLISVSGMETTLFVFLLLLAFYFFIKENFLWSGIVTALSVWARPEGLILALIFFIVVLLQRFTFIDNLQIKKLKVQQIIKKLIPFIVILSGYFLFNYLLSGNLLPNTYKAKIMYYLGSSRENFLKRDVISFFTSNEFTIWWVLFLLGLGWIIYYAFKRKYDQLFISILFSLTFVLIYYIQLPFSHRFSRYLMPVIPFFMFTGYMAFQKGLQYLKHRFKGDQSIFLNFLFVTVVAINLYTSISNLPETLKEFNYSVDYHNVRHVKVANWLKENTLPNSVIATHDIGALAFYSGRKIIDMVGLINPEVIPHLKDKNFSEFLKNYFIKNKVTHFVTMRNWFEAVNQAPIYVPINEFEYFEVFEFKPERLYLMPLEASFYNQQALIQIQRKNNRAAIEFLKRSLTIAPNSSRTHLLLGSTYSLIEDYNNAEYYLKRALMLFPEYLEANYELARVYFLKKDVANAKNYLTKALEINPDHLPTLQLMLTITEQFENNPEESQKYRIKISEINSKLVN